jgi:hypothetical protein
MLPGGATVFLLHVLLTSFWVEKKAKVPFINIKGGTPGQVYCS